MAPPRLAALPALLLAVCLGRRAAACENACVRDAAFLEERDVHRLCLITPGNEAVPELRRQIEAWFAESATALNVEFCQERADDPGVDWPRYGLPSAPPASPVAVLAGQHTAERLCFFVDHWSPAPGRAELDSVLDSPARTELRRRVARDLAVLLYFPAQDGDSADAQGTLERAAAQRSAPGSPAVTVLRVDRADPRERLLVSFAGLKPEDPGWVAVVFGRGKMMPPLVGGEISEAVLDEQLRSLLEPCTCLRSPGSLGVDMPLAWTDADQRAVALVRGPADADTLQARSGEKPARAAGSGVLVPTLLTLAALAGVQGLAALLIWWRRSAAPR